MSNTRIFCRLDDYGLQYLVYQMAFNAGEDVAMILPFPLARAQGEPEFINLQGCPKFFEHLDAAFHEPRSRSTSLLGCGRGSTLKVHSVGAFDASFVPGFEDFDRLDVRFRLPEASLPAMRKLYPDHAFAVFKLKAGGGEVHPMAFKFPSAMLDSVFFPTVHLHDGGAVPKLELFDHSFYVQVPSFALDRDLRIARGARRVRVSVGNLMKNANLRGIPDGLLADAPSFRIKLYGMMRNEDLLWKIGA